MAIGQAQYGACRALAAGARFPPVLGRIDWAGHCVYDQTCQRADEAGLSRAPIPPMA